MARIIFCLDTNPMNNFLHLCPQHLRENVGRRCNSFKGITPGVAINLYLAKYIISFCSPCIFCEPSIYFHCNFENVKKKRKAAYQKDFEEKFDGYAEYISVPAIGGTLFFCP
jgi:hypothetical protein